LIRLKYLVVCIANPEYDNYFLLLRNPDNDSCFFHFYTCYFS
jgi:hypothetical protein